MNKIIIVMTLLGIFFLSGCTDHKEYGIEPDQKVNLLEVPIKLNIPLYYYDNYGYDELEDEIENVNYSVFLNDVLLESGISKGNMIKIKNPLTNGKDYTIKLLKEGFYPKEEILSLEYDLKPYIEARSSAFIGKAETNVDVDWNVTNLEYTWDTPMYLQQQPYLVLYWDDEFTKEKTTYMIDDMSFYSFVFYRFYHNKKKKKKKKKKKPMIEIEIPKDISEYTGFTMNNCPDFIRMHSNNDLWINDRLSLRGEGHPDGRAEFCFVLEKCAPFTMKIKLNDISMNQGWYIEKKYGYTPEAVEDEILLHVRCRKDG